MKIDEEAFAKVVAAVKENFGLAIEMDEYDWEEATRGILAALPSAEPGRDRIAVVVNRLGLAVTAAGRSMTEDNWRVLEDEVSDGPFARAIIHCNLPRPPEPVEVEGSVEGGGVMTKRERAIRALLDGLWFDGQLVTDPESMGPSQLGRIVDRIAAIMAEPDEPPEGKLRVRGCLALGSDNQWVLAGAEGWSDGHMRAQAMDPFDADDDPVEIKWIESFVDKYAPPAEETVQGREVVG